LVQFGPFRPLRFLCEIPILPVCSCLPLFWHSRLCVQVGSDPAVRGTQ